MNEKKLIPEEVAFQICEEVRERNKKKKLSFAKAQCWGCMKYSHKKMTLDKDVFLERRIIEVVI